MSLATTIAMHTATPVAHTVAATRGNEMRDALLHNPHVDLDMWRELYTVTGIRKVSAKTAKSVVTSDISGPRVQHVMATEKRTSILDAMFKDTYPSVDLLGDPAYRALLSNDRTADRLHKRYGPVLDSDALAGIPAGDLAGPLRVWRLLSESLTDAEVLEEVRSYGTWATPYVQRPVGWVLQTRPHLLPDLIADDLDVSVVTQAAGLSLLGTLTRDQLHTLLRITGNAEDFDPAAANDYYFAWTAAISNPSVDLDTVDVLEKFMARSTDKYDNGNSGHNRRRYRPWSLSSLTEEVTAEQMASLVKWAAPTEGKTRVGELLTLIDNPSFTEDEAHLVAGHLQKRLTGDAGMTMLLGTPGHDLASKFAVEFPELEEGYQLVEAHRTAHVRLMGVAEALRRGVISPAVTDQYEKPAYVPPPPTVDPTSRIRFNLGPAQIAWIDQSLAGAEAGVWEMVYTMADTLADQTVEEFVATCVALDL